MGFVRVKYRMYTLNTGSVRMKPIFFGKKQFFSRKFGKNRVFKNPTNLWVLEVLGTKNINVINNYIIVIYLCFT